MLRHLARSAPSVALSRLRRGPARPSWSFGFELVITAMRSLQLDVARRSWAVQRTTFDGFTNVRSAVLKKVKRTPVTVGGVPCEWFEPRRGLDTSANAPTLLYFHGGAYVFGSTLSHAELIARIALASKARVLAPNYRLAPEDPFPAGLDDAESVFRALLGTGVAPSRLVVGGDSAGGGLTTALLLRLRDAKAPLPAGAFLICPWVDLSAKGGSLATNAAFDWGTEEIVNGWIPAYVGNYEPTHPLISPALAPDLSGLPPLLVQVGSAELMLDQVKTFARRAKEQGASVHLVVEEDMPHDWHSFAGLFRGCGKAIDEIGDFVRGVLPAT